MNENVQRWKVVFAVMNYEEVKWRHRSVSGRPMQNNVSKVLIHVDIEPYSGGTRGCGKSDHGPSVQFGYRLFPHQRRNKREILGDIIIKLAPAWRMSRFEWPPSRMSGSASGTISWQTLRDLLNWIPCTVELLDILMEYFYEERCVSSYGDVADKAATVALAILSFVLGCVSHSLHDLGPSLLIRLQWHNLWASPRSQSPICL